MATQKSDVTTNLNSLETTLEEYLVTKAPFQLPTSAKELIVNLAPWLIIIFSLMALPAILALIGLQGMMTPFMMGYGVYSFGPLWWLSTALLAIAVVLQFMALSGLFARTMQGWKYVYYAQLISIVSSLLTGNIIGAIIGGILGLYILFQVKEMYK